MPNSGIKPTDLVKGAYQQVFQTRGTLPYAVFKFSDDRKEVIVDDHEAFYEKQLNYTDLINKLPKDTPRFVAFEFHHASKLTPQPTKTPILISWCPQNCEVKLKFLVGATFGAMVTDLSSPKYMEGDQLSELDEASVLDKFDWKMLPADQIVISDQKVDISPFISQ